MSHNLINALTKHLKRFFSQINALTKYLKRFFSQKLQAPELQDTDWSSFLPDIPLTHRQQRQQRIEECEKLGISTCIDNPSEQSKIFCGSASVPELEHRLNAKKAIMNAEQETKLSKWTIFLALFLAFIEKTIALVKSFN